MTRISLPEQRLLVIACLEVLADADFQQSVWVDNPGSSESAWFGSFTDLFGVLDADSRAFHVPFELVGAIFVDYDEAEAMSTLAGVVHDLVDRFGILPDVTYLEDPMWSTVVDLARSTVDLMIAHDLDPEARRL